jgi:hypothetical protein
VGLRLIRVDRTSDLHAVCDVTVEVTARAGGRLRRLPADMLAPTAADLAAHGLDRDIEVFGLVLSEHVLRTEGAGIDELRVELSEQPWSHVTLESRPRPRTFIPAEAPRRLAIVRRTPTAVSVESGFDNLEVLRTEKPDSPATRDAARPNRGLDGARLSVVWHYTTTDAEFGLHWRAIRHAITDRFLQQAGGVSERALDAMADSAFEVCDDIDRIRLAMTSWTHRPADPGVADDGRMSRVYFAGNSAGPVVRVVRHRH